MASGKQDNGRDSEIDIEDDIEDGIEDRTFKDIGQDDKLFLQAIEVL